jgi:hypothetical protein
MNENINTRGRFRYLLGYDPNLPEARHVALPRRSGDQVQPEHPCAFQSESLCARSADTACRAGNHSVLIG